MRITVDHDPLVWLRGPDVDDPTDHRAAWLDGALDAYSRAYDLDTAEEGQAVRAYVGRVLEVFSRWETPAQLRFLRIRGLQDAFIPAGVEFYGPLERADLEAQFADRPDSDFATLIRRPDDTRHVVGETSLEEVATAPGWHRLFYSVQGEDRAIYSFVRYIRHFPGPGVTAVIRFGGDAPGLIASAVPDGDLLAASIEVSEEGDP